MKPDLVSGSPLWQTVFISFAVLLLFFQVVRGWRLGLPRQLVRIAAIVGAYTVALWGGRALLPILRSLVRLPDFILVAAGGALLAMIFYSLVNTLGAILFKRTGQQSSGLVRLVYGGSGAFLGIFFGLFFIALLIVGIRSVGAIAEAEIKADAPRSLADGERANVPRPRRSPVRPPEQDSLAISLARLKQSLELGSLGEAIKQTDVLPGGIYETLGKVGEVFARPASVSRFLSYPGVAELADSPKILALRADPEIEEMLAQGRLWDLMQDERLIDALNDPELARALKKFDLKKALDYAAKP